MTLVTMHLERKKGFMLSFGQETKKRRISIQWPIPDDYTAFFSNNSRALSSPAATVAKSMELNSSREATSCGATQKLPSLL
jgi:hypothetical protein